MKTLKWHYFTLLFTIFITAINYPFFSYFYANLNLSENLSIGLTLPLIFAGLLGVAFSIFFLPFLTKFLSVIIIFTSIISLYFMISYGVVIDSDMIRNAYKTDIKEVKELLNFKLILALLTALILSFLLIFKIKISYGSFRHHLSVKITFFILSAILALGLFWLNSKQLILFFRTYNHARVLHMPFYQFYSLGKFIKQEFGPKPEFKRFSQDAKITDESEKKLFVLVVGETARAANYSLNGYTKNDTNAYTKMHDIAYFSDASSCGTSTAISVPCMFSFSKKSEWSRNEYQENVLEVLQNLGVSITWLDNNTGGCQGVCDKIENSFEFKAEFDGILLEKFESELVKFKQNGSKNALIILHLQGSHGPSYYKRYPREFAKFSPTCDTNELEKCSEDAIYNTYDNTLLYTDFIVSKLVESMKNTDFKASLLYVSDHGESLGENGIYLHGLPYSIAPDTQTKVPFLAFSNDKNMNEILKKNKNTSVSHDAITPSLLGFFKVDISFYEPKLDIFNPNLSLEK